MVTFETKVYEETDDVIGAEVIVYSDSGKTIDKIYVTSKTDYDNLVSKLDDVVSPEELEEYISNLDFDSMLSDKANKTSVPDLEDITFVSKNSDSTGSIIVGYLK